MIKYYVTFYFPGAFFAETDESEIASLDIRKLKIPKTAYGFTLSSREVVKGQRFGKPITLSSEDLDPVTYMIGTFYSKERIEKEFGRNSKLFANVEDNGWLGACKTRMGNFTSVKNEAVKECIIDPSRINEQGFIEAEKPKEETSKEPNLEDADKAEKFVAKTCGKKDDGKAK